MAGASDWRKQIASLYGEDSPPFEPGPPLGDRIQEKRAARIRAEREAAEVQEREDLAAEVDVIEAEVDALGSGRFVSVHTPWSENPDGEEVRRKVGPLRAGDLVACTGRMSATRETVRHRLSSAGLIPTDTVNGRTRLLIVGEAAAGKPTDKMRKAAFHGVERISAADFFWRMGWVFP